MRLVQNSPAELVRDDPIRVAIVDDSVVVRGLLSRWLIEIPGIEVVGTYRSGRDIINNVVAAAPDIVILDIEMPDIDGLSALPHILRLRPQAIVIVASTLTARNAEISIRCISLGATDFLLKPQTNREVSTSADFRHSLIDKILTLGAKAKGRARARMPAARVDQADAPSTSRIMQAPPPPANHGSMRPVSRVMPKALLIGASTGGPQAVMALLKGIRPVLERVPVLIAQHMPAAFTTMFAEHLTKHAQVDVVQASEGEALRAGRVYVAPGGRHMQVRNTNAHPVVSITDSAPVNFCKPSADVLFESALDLMGAGCLAVVLTGMGVDGARGALKIADAGGTVFAQDEATSVVWGMPGATARLGACAGIMSLQQMAPALMRLLSGDRTVMGDRL